VVQNKKMKTATFTTATKWVLDPAHSELTFKVKHLMISTVTGRFKDFTVTAETEDEIFNHPTAIELIADTASVDTHNNQRDNHLRSADFFDAANNPQLVFKSTSYEIIGDEAKLYGELTIRGACKNVVLNVEPGGIATDPYGQTKAAFSVTGKISRKEFGLTWNGVTEAGGVVVSDEVKIQAEIQLIKQA
jgi:polyisoprenoid-binding protein YceI